MSINRKMNKQIAVCPHNGIVAAIKALPICKSVVEFHQCYAKTQEYLQCFRAHDALKGTIVEKIRMEVTSNQGAQIEKRHGRTFWRD